MGRVFFIGGVVFFSPNAIFCRIMCTEDFEVCPYDPRDIDLLKVSYQYQLGGICRGVALVVLYDEVSHRAGLRYTGCRRLIRFR
jgi:hypothetical protein